MRRQHCSAARPIAYAHNRTSRADSECEDSPHSLIPLGLSAAGAVASLVAVAMVFRARPPQRRLRSL